MSFVSGNGTLFIHSFTISAGRAVIKELLIKIIWILWWKIYIFSISSLVRVCFHLWLPSNRSVFYCSGQGWGNWTLCMFLLCWWYILNDHLQECHNWILLLLVWWSLSLFFSFFHSGELYELDGGKLQPISHGRSSPDSLLQVNCSVILVLFSVFSL